MEKVIWFHLGRLWALKGSLYALSDRLTHGDSLATWPGRGWANVSATLMTESANPQGGSERKAIHNKRLSLAILSLDCH